MNQIYLRFSLFFLWWWRWLKTLLVGRGRSRFKMEIFLGTQIKQWAKGDVFGLCHSSRWPQTRPCLLTLCIYMKDRWSCCAWWREKELSYLWFVAGPWFSAFWTLLGLWHSLEYRKGWCLKYWTAGTVGTDQSDWPPAANMLWFYWYVSLSISPELQRR